LGGLVAGGIIKRKEALYAVLVALISTGIFLFFDWRAMSAPPSSFHHIPRQIEIDSLRECKNEVPKPIKERRRRE